MKERLDRLAALAARRPVATIVIVLVLAVGGGVLALGLRPSTGTSTFVSTSSPSYQATEDFAHHFGGDTVIVLIREPLTDLVETSDLGTLSELEACLAGEVVQKNSSMEAFTPVKPGSAPPYGGYNSPCGQLMKHKPVEVVYGPGTFLNQAVVAVRNGINSLLASDRQQVQSAGQAAYSLAIGKGLSTAKADQAAKAAEELESEQLTTDLEEFYEQSGMDGLPAIDDPQFIPQVVFDSTRGANQPKARFAYLFPTADSALIQLRLRPSLSTSQEAQAIQWIREAIRMPMFRSGYGGRYTVTGEPVVVNALASTVTGAIGLLLLVAVIVMGIALLIVFRRKLRLLPLAIALAASGITFGAMSLIGASLTMASIAVLPILIGLAVDYAIQFQSRASSAETLATAALATATGFLVLLLSPVPMVQGFGLLLVVGIAIALLCALTVGPAALALSQHDGGSVGASLRGAQDILDPIGASLRGAREIVVAPFRRIRLPRPKPGTGRRVLAAVMRSPGRVLAVALALAVLGWIADTQTSVQSDITKLVPSNMPALRDLRLLERVTGVSGEIDVTVSAPDVTKLSTVQWMINYESSLLAHYGYLETKGCAHATLCPALSLPDLFEGATTSGASSGSSLTQSQVNSLLAGVPSYFSQAVITSDHREATLAFGIRLMPLSQEQRVIDYMNSQLRPPAGVTARLAGLPVLAAQANSALSSSSRRLLTLLAGLIAVGLVLLAVFRDVRRAVVPLVPIALATGWSALILYATRIPLNPMSATLGALVIAISTEFSVLLAERYRRERLAGFSEADALRRTYESTGRAVLASGITAIAGFGVLVASDITMLRDFGFVTLIDLTVSLAGVLLVLPAVLVAAERDGAVEPVGGLVARALAGAARLRRRPRVA
jgi:hydrophobe/amphiphile efflux-3 (HAE3) family protein